jgi:hypothetical protein
MRSRERRSTSTTHDESRDRPMMHSIRRGIGRIPYPGAPGCSSVGGANEASSIGPVRPSATGTHAPADDGVAMPAKGGPL